MQNIDQDENLCFYTVKYPTFEKELCNMEMRCLFNIVPEENFFFSKTYVAPFRSAFIKHCLQVMHTADSLEELAQLVLDKKIYYDDFKIRYVNIEDRSIPYEERRRIEYVIGYNVQGEADIHNPKTLLGVANVDGKWFLGMLEENEAEWQAHNIKPFSYSNALNVRVARALVNMAIGNNMSLSLIDPCCGIGTVVIEALSMGLDIKGYEINPFIAENAKKNLEFFGLKDVITNCSMHDTTEKFHAAIVDLPYGVFSPTTLEEQLGIISTTRKIADKAVFITFENMEEHFKATGFEVLDRCQTNKGKFVRYITICT
jgi:tRNA G10  N-methylase Trm11